MRLRTAADDGPRRRRAAVPSARVVAEVLPGRDAERLPQGRRREPVDRQPRPARRSARSPSWSTRRRRRSCGRWSPAPDGTLFVGTGNEGKVFRVDPQGKGSLFFDSAELEVHALALGAERRPLRRHLARRQDLQGRSQRHGDDVLRRRRQVHLGAGGRRARATSSPAPATRASSTRSRPTAKARVFYKTNTTHVDGARLRQERQPARRHRHARQGAAGRSRRQGVRAARLAVPGNPRAAVRRQGRALRRRAQRTAQRRRGAGRDRQRRRPGHRRRGGAGADRVGLRRDHLDVDRRHRRLGHRRPRRARIAARSRARSTASRPTASGISCGSRATTRRTT